MKTSGGERGQTIVWVAVFLPALLVVLGLVVDGGLALNARRDLQNVADRAARAGAMQIDEAAYQQDGTLRLDPGRATVAAGSYAAGQAVSSVSVEAGVDDLRVTVQRSWPTAFLRLFGVRAVSMSATGLARGRSGH